MKKKKYIAPYIGHNDDLKTLKKIAIILNKDLGLEPPILPYGDFISEVGPILKREIIKALDLIITE